MRGSIINRGDGVWQARCYVGRDEATGRKIYRTRTIHGSKRQAEDVLTALVNEVKEVKAGRMPESVSISVADFLQEWLTACRSRLADSTHKRYSQVVNNDIVPAIGRVQLAKLKPRHLEDLYAKAESSGRKRGEGGLSKTTIHHIHRILHTAIGFAVKRGYVFRNVVDLIDDPGSAGVEMLVLDEGQIVDLLAACSGRKYEMPILIAAYTGMRRGEVLGLKWADIDIRRQTISVRRSLSETRSGLRETPPKTKQSKRAIRIDAQLLEAFRVHKAAQDGRKRETGSLYEDRDLVCANDTGGYMVPKNLSTAFRQIVDKTKLPKVRLHDLRHTHATILLKSGVNAKVVAERLGHTSVVITLNTYAHVLPDMQEEAACVFSKALQAASEQDDREAA